MASQSVSQSISQSVQSVSQSVSQSISQSVSQSVSQSSEPIRENSLAKQAKANPVQLYLRSRLWFRVYRLAYAIDLQCLVSNGVVTKVLSVFADVARVVGSVG